MKKSFALILAFLLAGCTVTYKTAPDYPEHIKKIHTIAVMPADISVYKLTAGGVSELMDEWSETSKGHIRGALEKHLGERLQFEMKFIDEDWLKENHKDLWKGNKAMFMTVSSNILNHAYQGPNLFPTKAKNLDYTLGEEIQALSTVCGAQALMFIYGYDYESTTGRKILAVWNFMLGAAVGVSVLPVTPSGMMIALVDGTTGAVEWINVNPPGGEYSFLSKRHMEGLIRWLLRDFARDKR